MPNWLKDAVFYEIYPQSFYDSNGDGIGDFRGIIEKLDYVKNLGCNAVWLNPCFDSPFMDAGYDVRDYKKAAPRYGTNDDLIALFDAAHKKDMHVILDLVPGHTSEEHPWFLKSGLAAQNEFSNRYIWTHDIFCKPNGYNFISGRCEREGNYLVNFFSTQPALNYGFYNVTEDWQLPYDHPDCIATREAMKDVMRFWLDAGCDGFRVDMADSLVKNDPEKIGTCALWRNVREMFDRDYPAAALISEWCSPEHSLNAGFHCDFYLNSPGNGYYSLMRNVDEKTGEDKSFFSPEGKGDVRFFLDEYEKRYSATREKGYINFITCNHDTPRLGGRFDETALKIAYAFVFTMPGVPFLYYGDEIGMRYIRGLVSKEGGYFRTGTRTPMQWTGGQNAGFSTAAPDSLYLPADTQCGAGSVEREERRPDSVYWTVKRLIALRHEFPDLGPDGPYETLYAEPGAYPFIYRRGAFAVAVNPSKFEVSAPVDCRGRIVYSVGAEPRLDGNSTGMAPQSFSLLKLC